MVGDSENSSSITTGLVSEMSIFNFLLGGSIRRKKKYREEYRAMSENERDDHINLMDHYSVYGGPFSHREMIEMCEAAQEVENEEFQ